jgi:zinc protease
VRRGLLLALLMVIAAKGAVAGPIVKKVYPNGLTWIHKPVTHNSIMAFHLFLKSGAWMEPAQKAGITTLTTSVMFKGTAHRTSLQIAEESESLGIQLDASSEEEFWEMTGQATELKFEPAFNIFLDVLTAPSFPKEEFDKEKEALLNAIQSKKEQIFNIAYEKLQKEMFGDHPYGRPEEGTEETVSRITRDDLVAWHAKTAMPRGAVFVTVGPVDYKKLDKIISKTLGVWKTAEPVIMPYPKLPPLPKSKALQETQPFEQSYLMLGYRGPGIMHADYPAVKILNALLGAGMSSPLFHVVREEEGLAYEVSSFYPSRREGSAFVIYAGTDPKNLEKAGAKVKSMLDAFLKTPLDPKDLEDAKQFIRGHYMMDHQTNSRIAWYLGWWEVLGKGHDYDPQYVKDISNVASADVLRAAAAIFRSPEVSVKVLSQKK